MPRISIDNYDTVASWNGSQDLFVVEQPDGTKVATPAQVKQFIEAGDFTATGEVKDGHGNILNGLADQVSDINEDLEPQVITNLVIDITKMSVTGYDCIVKAGVCYLALYGCTFISSGTVTNGITNIPKAAKIQVCSCGYGSSSNAVAVMPEYAWISGLQTTVNFITTEANKSKARDYNFAYPVYS